MKHTFAIVTMMVLTACWVRGEDLLKISMDSVPTNGPTIEVDTKEKVEGTGSLKITTRHPTTVCVAEVGSLDIEAAKLVFQAKVKSELEGSAYLEIWVRVGDGHYFSRGLQSVVSQKTGWKTVQTLFQFQKGQKPEQVTLNLVINGRGTVWIDDIVLAKEPLK